MNELKPTEYLTNRRQKWLESGALESVKSSKGIESNEYVELGGKKWHAQIYLGHRSDRKFVIFELSRKPIFGSTHHCLGVELMKNKYSLSSNEELNVEGIP
jgi:hypothetical protein